MSKTIPVGGRTPLKPIFAALLLCALASGCATAPSGRSQLLLIGEDTMTEMGATAFSQLKENERLASNPDQIARAECVANTLIAQLDRPWRDMPWELRVFDDASPNAFALPGGKIGINSGLFDVARSQEQLAAVIGHEIAHVTSRHGAERVSQQFAADAALGLAEAYAGKQSSAGSRTVVALLGAGTKVGVLLPYSRLHESEADALGQQLMAEAGYDPDAAAELWRNMLAAQDQQQAPQMLSTHPNPEGRIRALEQQSEQLNGRWQQAIQQGRQPQCF